MNRRERIFLEEKENCKGPFYHIYGTIKDPALIEIDKLYGIADSLSIENAKKHEKTAECSGCTGSGSDHGTRWHPGSRNQG